MASEATAQNGHGELATPRGVTHDLLQTHLKTGDGYWRAVAVFSILLILGIVGFVLRLSDGFSNKALWGYHAAVFAFILTTAQAAPMAAIAPRLAKAHWRRPISRAAELWTVVGLFGIVLFIPMLWVLPGLEDGRRSLWFFDPGEVPRFSPHIWATLALVFLVIVGIGLLWVSSLPDLATVRDNSSGWRQRLAKRMAWGWIGTSQQWNMLHHRLGALGALYFMMLVFVHFLISVDFAMALVPGWIDALFPATHAANALQAGAATVLLTMFCLRQFGGYKEHIGLDQFWGLGKLMFALSLLWFWFWFSSFIVLWYGKKPAEQAALELMMVGPYLPAFLTAFILNFVVPLFTMIWNPLRKSIWGPTLIATSVLIGTFFDRIRLYVAAYSVPGIGEENIDKHELHLDAIPKANLPDIADIFFIVGAISGAILIYILATRIFPVVNIWEQRELLLYKVHKRFHRTEVMVLGKPE
jgi:molybdopterin-containing oxidoreductase family membrane subunit